MTEEIAVSGDDMQVATTQAAEADTEEVITENVSHETTPRTTDKHTDTAEHIHRLPDSAFRKIKQASLSKGRSAALRELAELGGYSSPDELLSHLKNGRMQKDESSSKLSSAQGQVPESASPSAEHGVSKEDFTQLAREMRLMQRRFDKQRKTAEEYEQRFKQVSGLKRKLEQERDALSAEMSVREAAARTGVRDIDYAVRLMTRHLQGKSEDDLKDFSEDAYFSSLRESHPYIFGEVARVVTTGNKNSAAHGSPPSPGSVQSGTGAGGKIDARRMSHEEFQNYLQRKGLTG